MDSESKAISADQRRWRVTALLWAMTLVLGLFLFQDTVIPMVKTWWGNVTFQHCFLILVIVAYLVWERRNLFTLTVPKPALSGLIFLAGAAFLWVLGRLVGALVVEEFALVFMIQSSVLIFFGWQVTRALILPLAYLLFAVPFGDFLVQPLQQVTADFSVVLLAWVDVPTYREGMFITTPSGLFHVAEACSGVRYLIAMLPLGVLFANISFKSWWRRSAVIALSIIVPIVANGIRAFGIIYIAYLTDNEYAVGVDHLIYGWVFFAFVTLSLIGLGMLFADKPLQDPAADYSWVKMPAVIPPLSRVSAATIASSLVFVVAAFLSFRGTSAPDDVVIPPLAAPDVRAPWQPVGGDAPWTPTYMGVAREIKQDYVRQTDGVRVSFYYGYYPYQQEGAELVQFGNTFETENWDWNGSSKTQARIADDTHTILQSNLTRYRVSRVAWSWDWMNGSITSNPYQTKLQHLWARLSGGDDVGVAVVISTEETHRREASTETLQDFLDHLNVELPGLKVHSQ